jgi:ABC-type transport system involved in multi-copper enzyme maturation permease subunit
MLVYKAWLESKTRFFCVLFGMFMVSGLLVLSYASWHLDPSRINFRGFIWQALYFRFFHAAWVFATLFLALGGLPAERHEGTALFTLSLPARRWRMTMVRVTMGLAEAVVAALLPAASVSAFALFIGQSYPVLQSLEFSLLLVGGGIVFFSLGVLLSTILRGDWTPLALGIPIIAGVYSATRSSSWLRPYNPQDLFSGAATVHAPAWALAMPLPWSALAISFAAALIFLLASMIVTEKLEF